MGLSENTESCHCATFFAEACFLGSQSPFGITGDCFVVKTLLAMTVPEAFADGH